MGYRVEDEEWGAYTDPSDQETMNRIMSYIGEIWGFTDFDSWWDTADLVQESAEFNEFPYMSIVSNSNLDEIGQTSPWAAGLEIYAINDDDVFNLLTALFRNVSLVNSWKGFDSVGGNTYSYSIEYDTGSMKLTESCEMYGFSCRNWKKASAYKFTYSEPKKRMVLAIAAKAAHDGDTDTSQLMQDLADRIEKGQGLTEEQKAWNLKYHLKKFSSELSSMKRKAPETDTLTREACSAVSALLKKHRDEEHLHMLRDIACSLECLFKVSQSVCVAPDDKTRLLEAIGSVTDEVSLNAFKIAAGFLEKKCRVREKIQTCGCFTDAEIAQLNEQLDAIADEHMLEPVSREADRRTDERDTVIKVDAFRKEIFHTAVYKLSPEFKAALNRVRNSEELNRAKEQFEQIRSGFAANTGARMFKVTKTKGSKIAFYDENGIERFLNNAGGKHAVSGSYIRIPETTQRYLKLTDYPQLF